MLYFSKQTLDMCVFDRFFYITKVRLNFKESVRFTAFVSIRKTVSFLVFVKRHTPYFLKFKINLCNVLCYGRELNMYVVNALHTIQLYIYRILYIFSRVTLK